METTSDEWLSAIDRLENMEVSNFILIKMCIVIFQEPDAFKSNFTEDPFSLLDTVNLRLMTYIYFPEAPFSTICGYAFYDAFTTIHTECAIL